MNSVTSLGLSIIGLVLGSVVSGTIARAEDNIIVTYAHMESLKSHVRTHIVPVEQPAAACIDPSPEDMECNIAE